MAVLRFLVAFGALLVLGLGVAFVVTRERRYLRIAWRSIQVIALLVIAVALLYVFERVLLI